MFIETVLSGSYLGHFGLAHQIAIDWQFRGIKTMSPWLQKNPLDALGSECLLTKQSPDHDFYVRAGDILFKSCF